MENSFANMVRVMEEGKRTQLVFEETIFDIIGKGYLENPLTDMLAFFCDPTRCHALGDSVARALIECIDEMRGIYSEEQFAIKKVAREEPTEIQKRVDLVLEGDDWVLGVEVKVNAERTNPFDEYRKHLSSKGKRVFTIIFAPSAYGTEILDWPVVQFGKFAEKVKGISTSSEVRPDSKWIVFLNDFLLNLQNLQRRTKMEQSEASFVMSHYGDIAKISEMKDVFEKVWLVDKCKAVLNGQPGIDISGIRTRVNTWREYGVALIFESQQWGKGQLLTLLLLKDGKYRVQFEVARNNQAMSERARRFAKKDWHNGGYWADDCDSIEKALTKFKETAMQFTAWMQM